LRESHNKHAVIIVPTNSIKNQLLTDMPGAEITTLQWFTNKFDSYNDGRICIYDEWHHLSQAKVKQFLLWKGRFVLCTATPSRENFDIKWFDMICGYVYETNARSLPVNVYITRHNTQVSLMKAQELLEWYAPDSAERRRILSYNDASRNDKISNIAERLYKKYNKVIVFTDRVYHADMLKEIFTTRCPDIFCIYDDQKHEDLYNTLANKESFLILCTRHSAGEWFNVPALTAGLSVLNTQEYRVVRQMIGRVRRFAPGKTHGIRVDIFDTVQIWESKKKYLAWAERRKHYMDLWFPVEEF